MGKKPIGKKAQFFPLKDENPGKSFPFVNWAIIILNAAVFLFTLTSPGYFINSYGFKPAELSILTLFTSMFLHAGIAHIFGNMWFLYIFGDNVEDSFGHFKYALFYISSGAAASVAHFMLNTGSLVSAVGASGAISGVLGAYIVLFPKVQVYATGMYGHAGKISAFFMIGIWFVFQLVNGAFSIFGAQSGIAFFAHIGGFIFGVAFALLFRLASASSKK